jgi:hypothetical protein
MKKIKLTRGKYALVDDEDFYELNKFKWTYGSDHRGGHALRSIPHPNPKYRRAHILMHNQIMGTKGIDHINMNSLDNRKSNLRKADYSQQGWNRKLRKDKKNGTLKGTEYRKSRKSKPWSAAIGVRGKRIRLGTFKTELAAHRAYIKAAKLYCGEFARWK